MKQLMNFKRIEGKPLPDSLHEVRVGLGITTLRKRHTAHSPQIILPISCVHINRFG